MRWFYGIMALGFGHVFACEPPPLDSTRIAIAGGSLTEIVYFLNAQDRIVATDTTSTYPPEARNFPSIGYVRDLSSEGILSLRPGMVLGEHDLGPPEVLGQLARTNVAVLKVPEQHTTAGIIDKVRCVAQALSLVEHSERRIASDLQSTLTALDVLQQKPPSIRVALLLEMRDGVPVAAGRNTSGDGFLKMSNVKNVFANIEGWKPVSLEAMVAADPDVILIPQRGVNAAGGIEMIAGHSAIRLTRAARNESIFAMDGMAMLGFGPRTLTAAIQFVDKLENAEHQTGAVP